MAKSTRKVWCNTILGTLLLIVLGFFGNLIINEQRSEQTSQSSSQTQRGDGDNQTLASEALSNIPIKGRAPKTGYSRDQFGNGWAKWQACDTRQRILQRDLVDIKLASDGCTVLSGTLHDPYTGKIIDFIRGSGTSSAVQIDHVVALVDAWQKGAQSLDVAKREQLANDDLELLAVDGPTNQQKGAGDAATWLPPNKSYRCKYVARQIAIKQKYSLWMTQAEHDAITGILESCPNQPLLVL